MRPTARGALRSRRASTTCRAQPGPASGGTRRRHCSSEAEAARIWQTGTGPVPPEMTTVGRPAPKRRPRTRMVVELVHSGAALGYGPGHSTAWSAGRAAAGTRARGTGGVAAVWPATATVAYHVPAVGCGKDSAHSTLLLATESTRHSGAAPVAFSSGLSATVLSSGSSERKPRPWSVRMSPDCQPSALALPVAACSSGGGAGVTSTSGPVAVRPPIVTETRQPQSASSGDGTLNQHSTALRSTFSTGHVGGRGGGAAARAAAAVPLRGRVGSTCTVTWVGSPPNPRPAIVRG